MLNTSFFNDDVEKVGADNLTDAEKKELIQKMNDAMARLMIPATIYISVLMVFGLVGNLMVCYFYGFKTKRTTNSFFIVVLALYDVIVCSICMPTEIVDIELGYTFENAAACKTLRFVSHLAAIGSILTLIAIATDRFKKICKSTKPQMSMKTAKLISVAIFGAALLLSWPALVIYSSIKVNIPNNLEMDLKGSDCTSTKDVKYKGYVLAFNGVHVLVFVLCSIELIAVYSVIGRSIYLHHKRLQNYKPTRPDISSTTNTSNVTEEVTVDMNSQTSHYDATANKLPLKEKFDKISTKPQNKKAKNNSSDSSERETFKLTLIMVIVTGVFILSFLPYLSLKLWRVKEGKHDAELASGGGLVALKIATRSFLLNSSLNPWIYGIFNRNFRHFFFSLVFCRKLAN